MKPSDYGALFRHFAANPDCLKDLRYITIAQARTQLDNPDTPDAWVEAFWDARDNWKKLEDLRGHTLLDVIDSVFDAMALDFDMRLRIMWRSAKEAEGPVWDLYRLIDDVKAQWRARVEHFLGKLMRVPAIDADIREQGIDAATLRAWLTAAGQDCPPRPEYDRDSLQPWLQQRIGGYVA